MIAPDFTSSDLRIKQKEFVCFYRWVLRFFPWLNKIILIKRSCLIQEQYIWKSKRRYSHNSHKDFSHSLLKKGPLQRPKIKLCFAELYWKNSYISFIQWNRYRFVSKSFEFSCIYLKGYRFEFKASIYLLYRYKKYLLIDL